MTPRLKHMLLACILSYGHFLIQAQYVQIPDSSFAAWLRINHPSVMSGNLLDTTAADLIQIGTLDVSNQNIASLDGLQYFVNLGYLYCSNNRLRKLPVLPPYLKNIDCRNNLIDSITNLPPHGRLFCADNKITKIILPSSFWELRCENNLLTGLPPLPYNLQTLVADSNLLESLPPLPDMMTYLKVPGNRITRLPLLNSNIGYMDLSYNLLDTIPLLPDAVRQLICTGNRIRHITNIPRWMTTLTCSDNLLEQLPAQWPYGFLWLDCSRNKLKSLPKFQTVYQLRCRSNLLTSLPEFPKILYILDCADNQIKCFDIFPTSINSLDISGNPFQCLPNHTPAMDSATRLFPLCREDDTVINRNGCPEGVGISGYFFRDYNSNCIFDPGEELAGVPVALLDSNRNFLATVYSGADGSYGFTRTKGRYVLRTDTAGLFLSLCDGRSERQLNIAPSQGAVENFGFLCTPSSELGVQAVFASGLVFPGQIHTLTAIAGDMSSRYGFSCAQGNGGTVEISYDGPVTYKSPSPNALVPAVNGRTLTYTIADFAYVQPNSFSVQMQVDTQATADDSACVFVKLSPAKGDTDPLNNIKKFCYRIVNSYDPNMKEVYPVNVAPGWDDRLLYTVHFQNTGNAQAINIRIADTLDDLLDAESFRVEAQSHAMKTTLYGKAVRFDFKDINLPDSHSNVAGSKGFVQYSIRARGAFAKGDQVRNTAYIYFDYNAPVVTNTTLNECVEPPSGLHPKNVHAGISVYPNPASGAVKFAAEGAFRLTVTDLCGAVLFKACEAGEITLPAGLYFFHFEVAGRRVVEKVLVAR